MDLGTKLVLLAYLAVFVYAIATIVVVWKIGKQLLEPYGDGDTGFWLAFWFGPLGCVLAYVKRLNAQLESERKAARAVMAPPRDPATPRQFR